jgi:hypothetical protein
MKTVGVIILVVIIFGFISGCDNPVDYKSTNLVPPASITPPDGATNVELDPTFVWSGQCNRLEIDYTPSFNPPIYSKVVSGTQFKIPAGILSYNTYYYWRCGLANGTTVVWSKLIFGFKTKLEQ